MGSKNGSFIDLEKLDKFIKEKKFSETDFHNLINYCQDDICDTKKQAVYTLETLNRKRAGIKYRIKNMSDIEKSSFPSKFKKLQQELDTEREKYKITVTEFQNKIQEHEKILKYITKEFEKI